MKEYLVFPVLLIHLFCTPAFADYQKGVDAANRGDYASALREWEPLSDQGDAGGQNGLGWLYHNGFVVQQDYGVAFELYTLSANQGFAEAQVNLGLMYAEGEGVTQDYKEAMKWYELAAAQGYAIAQNNLGVMYFKGKGVFQDYTLAHMWWDIAASQGNEDAAKRIINVENIMTPTEISKAQQLTRECVEKAYKDC